MKKQTFRFMTLFLGAALIASCNNDDIDPKGQVPDGEGNIQLVVKSSVNKTRAYTGNEAPVTGEDEIASTLSVFVYTDNGAREYYNMALPVTGNVTNAFKVSEGDRYFYVFSNGHGAVPASQSASYEELEKQVLPVRFENNVPLPIAKSGEMTIGTLWRGDDQITGNKRTVASIGYPGGSPQQIGLQIGRTAAKINLRAVDKGTQTNLKGTFTNPTYRLRSVPNKYFFVGQLAPPEDFPPQADRYISAVHDLGPGSTAIPSDIFMDYLWDFEETPGNPFYAVENTTSKQTLPSSSEENLYYGNTTYIQLKTTYNPADEEVYDGSDPTDNTPTLAPGSTFWVGTYTDPANNTSRLIFNSDPTATASVTDVVKYENGVMYYKLAIKDDNETGIERKYCVIRNHSYNVYVDNIYNLGEPTDEVDPETPITEDPDPDIQIHIEVLEWFRVDQHADL